MPSHHRLREALGLLFGLQRGRWGVWVLLAGVLAAQPAASQVTLYAAAKGVQEGSAPSSLYTLDPETGAATLVGPIEGPDPLGEGTRAYENVTGLAFVRDGRLVATADGDDFVAEGHAAILIEIDRTTGAATFIGVIDDDVNGTCGRMPGLTFDPASDTLYAIGNRCDPDLFVPTCNPEEPADPDDDYLYTIDPSTGAGTPVGVIFQQVSDTNPNDEFTPCPITSADGNGLAAPTNPGILVATRGQALVVIDVATAEAVRIGVRNLDTTGALDFQPVTLELFGATLANDGTNQEPVYVPVLNTFNLTNAATTRIGETTLDGEELAGVDAIAFRGPGGCPIAPVSLPCRGPGKSKVAFVASGGKLKWKWSRGAATSVEDWGDPVNDGTSYRLCWYDSFDGLSFLDTGVEVAPGEGWSEKSKGFKYKRPKGTPPGIDKLKLKAGESGRAKIVAKGTRLVSPVLPQNQDPAVTVQMLNSAGECWESVYGAPAKQNDESRFKEK